MTQAFNLSQLANNLNSSGQLDATDGLVNAVPVANGGTGASTAAAARANLDVPQAIYAVPSGGIIMWSGSTGTIPAGWFLCNGLNGTPNLLDRFVIAAGGSYGVSSTGGSKDAIVVSHTHTATDSGHTHSTPTVTIAGVSPGGGLQIPAGITSTTTGTSNANISVSSTGASGTNANLPPYYALAFIMKS